MDVKCERNIIFKLMSAGFLVLRIVIAVKFPVGLCSRGVAAQTGAQGELALDYKLNRGIKDCTVQVRMKTFSPMISILVNVFPHSLKQRCVLHNLPFILRSIKIS